jgi:hypothetical protein
MNPYCRCPECRELDSVPDGLWATTKPRPHTPEAEELLAVWADVLIAEARADVRARREAEQRALAEAAR